MINFSSKLKRVTFGLVGPGYIIMVVFPNSKGSVEWLGCATRVGGVRPRVGRWVVAWGGQSREGHGAHLPLFALWVWHGVEVPHVHATPSPVHRPIPKCFVPSRSSLCYLSEAASTLIRTPPPPTPARCLLPAHPYQSIKRNENGARWWDGFGGPFWTKCFFFL